MKAIKALILGLGRPRGGLGRRLRQQARAGPLPEVNDENCKPENIAKLDKSVQQAFSSLCLRRGRFQAQPETLRMVRC
jgi:entry exclusion lipoprotein TrbK